MLTASAFELLALSAALSVLAIGLPDCHDHGRHDAGVFRRSGHATAPVKAGGE
jgi:hypothetical protein